MIEFDLLDRSTKTLEGHIGGLFYYVYTLQYNFICWILLLFGGFVAYQLLPKNSFGKDKKNYMFLITLWVLIPFLFYTKANTKTTWYILPVYPVFAICIGAFSNRLLRISARTLVLQVIIIFSIMFSLYRNENIILSAINRVKTDTVQTT